jgi:hypothetical protein
MKNSRSRTKPKSPNIPKPRQGSGGRKKAVPGKVVTGDVRAKLAEMGCDPFEGLARIASNPDASATVRKKAFHELMKYGFPEEQGMRILRLLMESPGARELFRELFVLGKGAEAGA